VTEAHAAAGADDDGPQTARLNRGSLAHSSFSRSFARTFNRESNSFGFLFEKCKRIQIDLLNKRSNYFIMVYRSMCSCFGLKRIEN
jgi:hypothetical protein